MIYDVSLPLREPMPTYPGDLPFRREVVRSTAEGANINMSYLHMSAHCGTHVDAPSHMTPNGGTVGQIAPEVLVGPAEVVAIANPKAVTLEELQTHHWDGLERVLFRTANSAQLTGADAFCEDFAYLAPDAAAFLAEAGLKLVGLDYLTLDPVGSKQPVAHHALMRAGIVVIEGLDLASVPPGRYTLFCGALPVQGGDGAPARVFLLDL